MNCNACSNEELKKEGTHSKKLLMVDGDHFEEWEVPLCLEHYQDINKALHDGHATIILEYVSGKKVIVKNP